MVAAASGAVGSAVGQIARLKGARAVGIAGGKEKCDYVMKELGFDDCLDHRDPDLAAKLKDACPKGIDVYFENVGGAVFEAVFPLLNTFARVPVCGLIAHYNDTERDRAEMGVGADARGADQAPDDPRLHRQRFRRAPRRLPARHVGLGARGQGQVQGVRDRRARQRARAFIGLLKGANFGKQLVRVGPDKA